MEKNQTILRTIDGKEYKILMDKTSLTQIITEAKNEGKDFVSLTYSNYQRGNRGIDIQIKHIVGMEYRID